MITSLIILPEILSLANAKLSEKLLLAIYWADPKAKWPLRSMSMTKAGLAKLEARLVSKGLLAISGGTHVVRVPGSGASGREGSGHTVSGAPPAKTGDKLALSSPSKTQATAKGTPPAQDQECDDHEREGHSVSISTTSKTGKNLTLQKPPAPGIKAPMTVCADVDDGRGNKGHSVADCGPIKKANNLASPQSEPLHSASIVPLVVPVELLRFKYLSAAEKVLLAVFVADPCAQNWRIIETLNLSKSGLKLHKKRLLRKRVLVPGDAGFIVRLPGLILISDADGSHFIPETEANKAVSKMAPPPPRLTPANDIFEEWKKYLVTLERDMDCEVRSLAINYTVKMMKRIEAECPEGRERDCVLSAMKQMEDAYFLTNFVYENCPRKHDRAVIDLLKRLSPAQRATLRVHAEGMVLVDDAPKLLGMLTNVTSQKSKKQV